MGSVGAWALSLSWEAFEDLNRAANAEFLDLVARDVSERRRIWEEAEDTSGMRRAVEGLPGGSGRWATFLTFNERMSATIEREARERGIAVCARTPGVSLDDLSRAVMGELGFEPVDGSASGWRGVGSQRLRRTSAGSARTPSGRSVPCVHGGPGGPAGSPADEAGFVPRP